MNRESSMLLELFYHIAESYLLERERERESENKNWKKKASLIFYFLACLVQQTENKSRDPKKQAKALVFFSTGIVCARVCIIMFVVVSFSSPFYSPLQLNYYTTTTAHTTSPRGSQREREKGRASTGRRLRR